MLIEMIKLTEDSLGCLAGPLRFFDGFFICRDFISSSESASSRILLGTQHPISPDFLTSPRSLSTNAMKLSTAIVVLIYAVGGRSVTYFGPSDTRMSFACVNGVISLV